MSIAATIPAALYVRVSRSVIECPEAIQKQIIARYATENNFAIVKRYEDINKSGLSLRTRNGFKQMLADIFTETIEYKAILVFDTSRWGRFQNTDEAAYYEFFCKSLGVSVHYCGEPLLNDGSPQAQVLKTLKRIKAAEYSRRLSTRCFRGQRRLAEMGYRVSSEAGYGLCRAMVNEDGKIQCILKPGQRKFLQSCRTILVPGSEDEVAVIREIFRLYLRHNYMTEIADILNARGVRRRSGKQWSATGVYVILTNPAYAGINVWNRRSMKLAIKEVRNPRDKWVFRKDAFPAIISIRQFQKVQAQLVDRVQNRSDEQLLEQLKRFVRKHGDISSASFGGKHINVLPCNRTYSKRFGSLRRIYQLIGYQPPSGCFKKVDNRLRNTSFHDWVVRELIKIFGRSIEVCQEPHNGMKLTLDGTSTIAVRICCKTGDRMGRIRWRAYWGNPRSRDFDLLCLLDETNSNIYRYYLIRPPCPKHKTFFDLRHTLVKSGTRILRLAQLKDVVMTLQSFPMGS